MTDVAAVDEPIGLIAENPAREPSMSAAGIGRSDTPVARRIGGPDIQCLAEIGSVGQAGEAEAPTPGTIGKIVRATRVPHIPQSPGDMNCFRDERAKAREVRLINAPAFLRP